MKKILKVIPKIILFIALLDFFAFLIYNASTGRTDRGFITQTLKEFARFPIVFHEAISEVKDPEKYIDASEEFEPINNLTDDIYAVNAHYEDMKWVISLSNLKNDSVLYRWYLRERDFNTFGTERIFSHSIPRQPILLSDSSIIFSTCVSRNLFRIDKDSKIIWHNTNHSFHHSINLDSDNNLWTCTHVFAPKKHEKKARIITDDFIAKIDIESGKTLFIKSIREILVENGMPYVVYGNYHLTDPFHLNDIQPVLKDGTYWKTGDLFISLRNKSMILLYRPSTNKILRVIKGGFFFQHDVDIETDSTITLFNNNVTTSISQYSETPDGEQYKFTLPEHPYLNEISEVVRYNFIDSSFSLVYHNQFIDNKIFTDSEGLHYIFPNGDMFVESQNEGKVYIFNNDELKLRKFFNPIKKGKIEPPHWVRIYEDIDFLN